MYEESIRPVVVKRLSAGEGIGSYFKTLKNDALGRILLKTISSPTFLHFLAAGNRGEKKGIADILVDFMSRDKAKPLKEKKRELKLLLRS